LAAFAQWLRRAREALVSDKTRVFTASGELEAQQIQGFLAAAGIESHLRGEALRKTHGLTVDGLGTVEILVSISDEQRARELLAEADSGAFRLDEDAEV
jgi:hypothetical protein